MSNYTEIFNFFAKSTNTVNIEIVPNLHRQAGHILTERDCREIIAYNKPEVTYKEFLEIAESVKKISKEKLRKAFLSFDTEKTGYVNVGVLKNILRDEMEDLEIEEVVGMMNPDCDGRINYEMFLGKIDE